MSRVRIYELAKELGVSSKELTDKVVALGIEIKGPSSTIDDDVAKKLRSSMTKKTDAPSGAKRSQPDSATVTRRPTVILRKAKAEAEAPPAAVEEPVIETPAQSSAPESVGSEQDRPEQPREKQPADRGQMYARVIRPPEKPFQPTPAPEPKPVKSTAPHTPDARIVSPLQPKETVSQGGSADTFETQAPKLDTTAVKETSEQASPADVEIAETKAEASSALPIQYMPKRPEKRKFTPPPVKRGIARVVGTIALPQGDEEAEAQPKKRPVAGKPVVAKKAKAETAENVVAPAHEDVASRNKKKGRKGSEFEEDDSDRRGGKGAKKNQKNLKFTHFGDDYQRGGGKKGKKSKNRNDDNQQPVGEMRAIKKRIKVYDTISVGELASRMRVKASELIAKLMGLGVLATMNQAIDLDTATLLATDFGYEVEEGITEERGVQLLDAAQEGGTLIARPPVVTVMGHVDHGKTSILDAIRKTDVVLGEAGGITQHIGAYHVRSSAGDVTFVDTPGHAAFTEMRSRGAQVTDIVILVVAADDGVMEQTKEAIHHAQAANVTIMVAVNKIDKPNADSDRVKRELSDLKLVPEDWGGQTIFCETSAKKNIGIDELMESIQLVAEMLELKADPNRSAKGRVIEAKLDKGRGAVATVLVQDGTLKNGDHFVVGQHSGKVRAMFDDKGRKIKIAGPSMPVEVQGLAGVPSAGDEFIVVTDEKMAKNVSQARTMKARETELGKSSKISLDRLYEKMSEGSVQELRVIIRADVQGTLEAFAKAAEELSTKEIKVKVLHEGTGTISDSDILLASASEAIILGFNVRPTVKVKELAAKENVDIRSYDVIYHALDDIRKAMLGMLEPTYKENVIGTAEVRNTFSVPKVGTIAGCYVQDGKIQRNAGVRVLREGVVVFTGKISSLKRFKDDAKEVLSGYECGIGVENFNDIKIGDALEAFILQEIEATLE